MRISHNGNGTVKVPNEHCEPDLEKRILKWPENKNFQIFLYLKFCFANANESFTERNPEFAENKVLY